MNDEPKIRFVPRELKLDYDPAGDPDSPWVTQCEHKFVNGVFVVTVPANFRSDLASVPGAVVMRLTTALLLLGSWLAFNAHGSLDWRSWVSLALIVWLQGKVVTVLDAKSNHQRGALFHDAAYRQQFCEREDADAIFRAIMRRDGVPWWRRQLLYAAVRSCGSLAWRKNSHLIHRNRAEMGAKTIGAELCTPCDQ